jgi:hypothetical protein
MQNIVWKKLKGNVSSLDIIYSLSNSDISDDVAHLFFLWLFNVLQ